MRNIPKKYLITEISEDARRQYIDAKATFRAWENARDEAAQVRGGMYWKEQNGNYYLMIRHRKQEGELAFGDAHV